MDEQLWGASSNPSFFPLTAETGEGRKPGCQIRARPMKGNWKKHLMSLLVVCAQIFTEGMSRPYCI